MFSNITQTMERVCFVISVAGLDRPDMGMDGGDGDDCNSNTQMTSNWLSSANSCFLCNADSRNITY
jgi:hypothetical protein